MKNIIKQKTKNEKIADKIIDLSEKELGMDYLRFYAMKTYIVLFILLVSGFLIQRELNNFLSTFILLSLIAAFVLIIYKKAYADFENYLNIKEERNKIGLKEYQLKKEEKLLEEYSINNKTSCI